MIERYVIKLQFPVRAKRGEARGKGGLLQKCVIFSGPTREEALRDAKAWEEAHNASPYGEIVARGWNSV